MQKVSNLAVSADSAWLLSGSDDANVQVWSIPTLLSFESSRDLDGRDKRSPIRTLSSHRGQITALACGHGRYDNIAVTGATDSSVIIWDYLKGESLRTYLLESIPQAIAFDTLDRGFFATFDDGSVQLVEFFGLGQDQAVNSMSNGDDQSHVLQPGWSKRWKFPSDGDNSASDQGCCLALSWDGSQLLSGHQTGNIALWDVATGKCQPAFATLPGPVSNISMMPVSGLSKRTRANNKIPSIVKPRIGGSGMQADAGVVPGNYTFSSLLTRQAHQYPRSSSQITNVAESGFTQALTHTSFPRDMLEEGLAELAFWNQANTNGKAAKQGVNPGEEGYLSLDTPDLPGSISAEEQNALLKAQIEEMRRIQRASSKHIEKLVEERVWMEKDLIKLQRVQDEAQLQQENVAQAQFATHWNGLGLASQRVGNQGAATTPLQDGKDAEMPDVEAQAGDEGEENGWPSTASSDKG